MQPRVSRLPWSALCAHALSNINSGRPAALQSNPRHFSGSYGPGSYGRISLRSTLSSFQIGPSPPHYTLFSSSPSLHHIHSGAWTLGHEYADYPTATQLHALPENNTSSMIFLFLPFSFVSELIEEPGRCPEISKHRPPCQICNKPQKIPFECILFLDLRPKFCLSALEPLSLTRPVESVSLSVLEPMRRAASSV